MDTETILKEAYVAPTSTAFDVVYESIICASGGTPYGDPRFMEW